MIQQNYGPRSPAAAMTVALFAGLTVVVSALSSPRLFSVVYSEYTLGVNRGSSTISASSPSVVSTVFCVFFAALIVIYAGRVRSPAAVWATRGALLMWLGYVMAQVSNDQNALSARISVLPLAVVALSLDSNLRFESALRLVKAMLLSLVGFSLAAGLLIPSFAVDQSYRDDLLTFVTFRLYGVTSHPNQLGSIAALLILVGCYLASRRSGGWLCIAVGGLALAATFSKGSVVALAICLPMLLLFSRRPSIRRVVSALPLVFAALSIVAGFLYSPDGSGLSDAGSPEEAAATLTGRSLIWNASVQSIMDNPLLGAGGKFWGESMREAFAPVLKFAPGQAHNMYLQNWGEGGFLALTGLIIYMGALVACGAKPKVASGPASLVVASTLFVRLDPVASDMSLVLLVTLLAFGAVRGENDLKEGHIPARAEFRPKPF
jgi:O-antigen ligase